MIRHLGKYYEIIVKNVNEKKLLKLKHEFEDLKKANEKLWKCFTGTSKEFNELKIKMEEKEPDEEFDSESSNAFRDFSNGYNYCVR